jgi:threonine dehydrogenase-like Zn-dependent dehydrogenase
LRSGECFYCRNGFSSRCEHSQLFGSLGLAGGQAQYVRVPLADSTIIKPPPDIDPKYLVLMADIWPTGYFGASNAFTTFSKEQIAELTVVVIGCGPVGLCAVINAEEYKPKHLFAVDSVESRLEQARKLGAEPLNFLTDREGLDARIKEVTDGRGADVVIEVVGLSAALKLGFDVLRPWGVISSVGVHNAEVSRGRPQRARTSKSRCLQQFTDKGKTRFPGREIRRTARIFGSRWDDARSDPYSPRL